MYNNIFGYQKIYIYYLNHKNIIYELTPFSIVLKLITHHKIELKLLNYPKTI